VADIEAEDFNCNIRRYVDNAPPPEPHDVRAHLRGGVPKTEVDSLGHFWSNYPDLRRRCFRDRKGTTTYLDFSPEVTDRRALALIVNNDTSVVTAHAGFVTTLDAWWKKHLPEIEALAPANGKKGNVYVLRRDLIASIDKAFQSTSLLTGHQTRGAFARYMDELKADLKSIAASGWGPELIPDSIIIENQFPDVLADMEAKRTRLDELNFLFSAADEEDYEDSDDNGVLPSGEVKELKSKLKELRGEMRIAKRDRGKGDWHKLEAEADAIEAKLARHKALEDEARQLKADLRAMEKMEDDLVAAAREKIGKDDARATIVDRMHQLLVQTYESYLKTDRRACIAALENLYSKYAVTAEEIEKKRNEAAAKLKGFLKELGYD
jgi:type I restriction enzyme M protein